MINHALKRNMSLDIVYKLRPKGNAAKNYKGMADPRLFTGENKLHAKMDTQTTLWHLEYDHGALPLIFKQQFTGLRQLNTTVKNYFENRDIEIVEIID